MKPLTPTLVFLIVWWTSPSASAANPLPAFSKIVSFTGDVTQRGSLHDPIQPVRPGNTLLIGTELFFGPGASAVILLGGTREETLTNLADLPAEQADYTIAEPEDLIARERASRINGTYIAGVERGSSRLFCPASNTAIRLDTPVEFRWRPDPAGGSFCIAVSVNGKWVWSKQVPADHGAYTDAALAETLAKLHQEGATQFSFVCVKWGSNPSNADANTAQPLPPAAQRSLLAELSNCGDASDPWHHFNRASAFSRVQLFTETLRELELALADPRHRHDASLLKPAAAFANAIGCLDQANQWKAASTPSHATTLPE